MKEEDIVDVLDKWLDSRLRNIHTILPGQILSYEGHSTRKAKVKPLIKLRTRENELVSIPPIENVPVIFPSALGFSLLFPIKKNDGCLIAFAEEGIGNFLNSNIESDSDDQSRFNLTDAICFPGLWSFKTVPDSSNIIEIDDTGNIILNCKAQIQLNGNSKSFVTYAELNSALQALVTALNTHAHTGVTTGPGTSGPPASPLNLDISGSETETIKTGG